MDSITVGTDISEVNVNVGAVATGGNGVWGSITGTLSNQADLQTALNAKQNTLTEGNLTEATSSILTITGGTNAVIGSGTSIQVKQASATQNGYLGSADWSVFNNKQSALTIGNLTVGSNLSVSGGTGAVIGSGASISLGASVVTSVVNDTNVTGSIATNALTFGWAGTLSIARGGTGQSTASAAFNALSPITALGDIIYGSAANTSSRLAGNITTTKQFFTQTGNGTVSAAPAWGTIVSADLPTGNLTEATSAVLTITSGSNSVIGSGTTIQVKMATGSQSGYLASSDWTTFNNKQNAITTGTTAQYLRGDLSLSNFNTDVRSNRLDQMAAPTAPVSMNSQKIINLLDPTSPQDATTKNYVDNVAQGLSPKGSVRVATTAALSANTYNNGVSGVGATLTANANGALSVDGVSVAVNDRVLVQNEATSANNGIYTVSQAGDGTHPYILTRSLDTDDASEIVGAYVFVEVGTVNASSGFVCTTTGAVTMGTSGITFVQFTGAAEITVVAPIVKTGNQLSFSASYAGQTSITTLGTISTGTWNGSVINKTYLDSSVVTSITNDTNVTGSISAQVLTLGWSGTLSIARGGTNASTASAAFNNLSPLTTLGDILYASGANTNARLAGNTSSTKNFLTQTGNGTVSAAPAWGTIAAGDLPSSVVTSVVNDTNVTGSISSQALTLGWTGTLGVGRGGTGTGTTFTQGSVVFAGASGVYSQDNSKFFWDDTNIRLGIGNGSPGAPLDITGATFLTAANNAVGSINQTGFTITKNDTNTRTFYAVYLKPTLNAGASNTNTTLNILAIDTVNTATTGITTNLMSLSYGGSNKFNLDSSGNITNATWNGAAVGIAYGGTGQTTKQAAFDALSPLASTGDLVYYNGTHNVALSEGTNDQILGVVHTGTGLEYKTLVAGTNITLTPIAGQITIAATAGSAVWNSIGNPTGNQALTMGAFTSTWTWNAATGSAVNLFNITDTTNNTGTGYLMTLGTASGSAAKPFRIQALGTTVFDITNAGLITARITEIDDTNGNKELTFAATGSAVDYITITNGATANPATVSLGAAGSDANININITSKGTGAVQANGVTIVDLSSAQTLTNKSMSGTSNTFTNISLTSSVTGTLPIGNGGTNATSASAAFNNLSPMTTLGDILYGGASGAGTRLAGNTTSTKQFLSQTGTGSVSAAPAWGALASGDITSGLGYTPYPRRTTVSPATDGTTTVFTIGNALQTGSDMVYKSGLLQIPTTDYTLSGTTLTFVTAPLAINTITVMGVY